MSGRAEQHTSDAAESPPPTSRLLWHVDGGVLYVIGEVDAATAEVFATALSVCNDDVTVAALDLSNVSFFSAAGVRCFVGHGWTTRAHPPVIASPVVRRILAACGVDFLLERHGWVGGSVRPPSRT